MENTTMDLSYFVDNIALLEQMPGNIGSIDGKVADFISVMNENEKDITVFAVYGNKVTNKTSADIAYNGPVDELDMDALFKEARDSFESKIQYSMTQFVSTLNLTPDMKNILDNTNAIDSTAVLVQQE